MRKNKLFLKVHPDFHDLKFEALALSVDPSIFVTNYERIDNISNRIASLFEQKKITRFYCLGRTYADFICCLVATKVEIPFVLLSPFTSLKDHKDIVFTNLYEKAESTIFLGTNIVNAELAIIKYIKASCNSIALLTHKEKTPSSFGRYSPLSTDKLKDELFLIKVV